MGIWDWAKSPILKLFKIYIFFINYNLYFFLNNFYSIIKKNKLRINFKKNETK